ncbi:MAG: hypothetical protein IKF78_01255 [Atopobiaceae bacterium]|nr:hypothetical protein [Atopobiaceae bacterium]
MATQQQKKPPFKKAYAAAARKLIESDVSAKERIVYDALTRMSELKGRGYTCSRAQKEIAEETGLTEGYVKALVNRLRKRHFFWNGTEVPVIELLQPGSRGHTSIYRDNLTAWVHNPGKDPMQYLYGQEAERYEPGTAASAGEYTCRF